MAKSNTKIKILVFLEEDVAYTAADLTGVARLSYPSSIRIIPVPSGGRVRLEHILHAFASGADGVMLLDSPVKKDLYEHARARARAYRRDLKKYGISTLRLWFRGIYVPSWRMLPTLFRDFHATIETRGPLKPETRDRVAEALARGRMGPLPSTHAKVVE